MEVIAIILIIGIVIVDDGEYSGIDAIMIIIIIIVIILIIIVVFIIATIIITIVITININNLTLSNGLYVSDYAPESNSWRHRYIIYGTQ